MREQLRRSPISLMNSTGLACIASRRFVRMDTKADLGMKLGNPIHLHSSRTLISSINLGEEWMFLEKLLFFLSSFLIRLVANAVPDTDVTESPMFTSSAVTFSRSPLGCTESFPLSCQLAWTCVWTHRLRSRM